MTETRYPALRRYVSETPWALHPSTLLLLREIIGRRLDGDRLSAEEIAEITAAAPKRAAKPSQGTIAVLPLWGILSPHQVSDLSSGPTTALDTWGALFDELVNDPSVATIVLDVDSPGGSVDLVPETAAKVRAANARKQIVAVANTRAASAAYWIASQAGDLIVSPSGAVGSIGVYAAHEDVSQQLEAEGVTMTLISAGDHKTDGNPFEPLSDDARSTIQANVNAYYGMFTGDVAKGRGVEPGVVEAKFGQGKMLLAGDAVKVGMADAVGTLEQVIANILGGKPATKRARAAGLEPALAASAIGDSTGITTALPRLVLAAAAAAELAQEPAALEATIVERDDPAAGQPDVTLRATTRADLQARVKAFKDSGGASAAGSAAAGGDHTTTKETTMRMSIEELEARRDEIAARMTELDEAAGDGLLEEAAEAEFEELKAELQGIDGSLTKVDDRRATLKSAHERVESRVRPTPPPTKLRGGIGSNVDRRVPENLHDLDAYRGIAASLDEARDLQREGARFINEDLDHEGRDQAAVKEHVESVLKKADPTSAFARRMILAGSPEYERAFAKLVTRGRDAMGTDEFAPIQAAISDGGLGSETPVPITIDPTVQLSTDGATNPIRQLARTVTIVGNTWRGITSGGVTVAYEAELAEVADQTPSFNAPDVTVVKAHGYVEFSIEVDEDWGALRGELAREFADAKDVAEASKFLTGSGTNEPEGLITALTASTAPVVVIKTAATATFAIDDPDLISDVLPPRFDSRASWLASKTVWAKTEALYRAAGNADPFSFAEAGLPQPLISGQIGRIFRGYPMFAASDMDAAFGTSGKNIMVLGDFGRGMVIVDRIGMNVELIPLVMGADQRPKGARALYAYFRNNTSVQVVNAFRVLQVK